MKAHATEAEIQAVAKMVEDLDYNAHIIRGVERTVVACVGDERGQKHQLTHLESVAGVERVMPVVRSFKLASREVRPEGSRIKVGNAEIGGRRITVIAGPCAVESEAQIEAAADAVKAAGAHALRGGAFKPRTSPYSFQGMEDEGLVLLEHAGRRVGLPVVTEIMDPHDIDLVAEHSDMLQVGARNAQNFSLLRRLGRINKPVLLKAWTHLPVVVDPSHGTGIYSLVAPMALAAIAAGADGLLIEVHPKPESALSDGPQQLKPSRFADLMKALKPLAEAVGRTL